jgi:hypothetical protein
VVLAIVSKEWLASSWCKSEIDGARLMGKKVIAALVRRLRAKPDKKVVDHQAAMPSS